MQSRECRPEYLRPSAFVDTDAPSVRAFTLQPTAYCVPKAVLLTAAYRAGGIRAAVGFADVRNHLNSPNT